ncbi:MAG TPA: hypothetical protein VE690_00485 [Rhodopila sp.]|jgi:hypothetical protein|nr:hypothetical protein [Rhodopila sp.]
MARTVTTKRGARPAGAKRAAAQPARKAAKAPARTAAKAPAAPQRGLPVELAIPEAPADEFQDRLEQLEKAHATLRTRQQAAARAAKACEARLVELEARMDAVEQRVARAERAVQRTAKPASRPRPTRRSREVDPGDSVPEGVAVREPEPLDQEAEAALEQLQHIREK